jgi:propionyl-CoA carboxylase beta chain
VKNHRKILIENRKKSLIGGGPDRIEKQHLQNKWTARERINHLIDAGTFFEFDAFVTRKSNQNLSKPVTSTEMIPDSIEESILTDGVITGIASIAGRQVAIFSQDFTCWGGSLGEMHAKKICKIMSLALKLKIPIIGLNDSGGARIQEGVESLAGYADIFKLNVQCSGVIPQISVILGPCAGGAVYSPAMTDFIIMTKKNSYMFVTGPDVIKTVTHENVSKDELGGAQTHLEKSGVCHFVCDDETHALEKVREVLSFIPSHWQSRVEKYKSGDIYPRESKSLQSLIPEDVRKPYDMLEVILEIVDDSHFCSVQKDFAPHITCGFARIGGYSIGIVANNPLYQAGVLDIHSSTKAARFVRFCDAFQIPILTLVDVPGFLPGVNQEHGGIIRHGAKLLYAYCEATVPMVTLITRKAYGGAYDVMASKHIGADYNFALPHAEIAVMGADGAVNILYSKELKNLNEEELQKKRNLFKTQYEEEFVHPYKAAALGYIDEIILPEEVRGKLIYAFQSLVNKEIHRPERKHGNIPL